MRQNNFYMKNPFRKHSRKSRCMLRKPLLFLLILLPVFAVNAQVNDFYKENLHRYRRAVRIFEQKNYDLAAELFDRLRANPANKQLLPDIDYYLTEIAIRRDESNSLDIIRNYLNRYPESPYRLVLSMHAIDRLFAQGNLRETKRLIDETDVYALPAADRERIDLYLGYIALKDGDTNKAKRYFKELLNSRTYGDQAKYYLGYIAYLKNNPVEAQRYFSQLKNKKGLTKNVPYYNADMYYNQGMFRKAVEEGLKIYPSMRGKQRSQLAKIIGSSYFNLKEYDKAIPYLKSYRGKKGKWNNKDYYELGYAYYKTGNCAEAEKYFNKIINSNTPLAQNAYYHLAKCNLKSGDKAKALNAFKKVSEMNFDKKIKEDAWYNYIKLGYEIGNPYETMDEAVKSYLKAYPQSVHKKELNELTVNAYLTSHNYAMALKAMEQNGMQARPAYQKVAFLRGMEFFKSGKYADAVKMFDLSLKHGFDRDYRDKAVFWKAEALYRMGKYRDALTEYQAFEKSDNQSDKLFFERKIFPYNMGYVHFKLKNYPEAAKYFSRYLQGVPDDKLKKDAYLRLGDSYFASKKYWPAMDAYNKAIAMKGPNADYAFYQKAISYGFVGRPQRKIEELKKFLQQFPHSKLTDDALYQLGSQYLNDEKYTAAVNTFNRLLTQFPDSPYGPVAMLKTGLAYYNQNKNEQAKTVFRNLITKHPHTPEAHEAAQYLKSIYIDENNPDAYVAFISKIPGFQVKTSGIEKDLFQAAEEKYFDRNWDAARESFETYLKKFPQGMYRTEALHYLAKIALRNNDEAKAVNLYKQLLDGDNEKYKTEALRYLALTYLKNNQPDKAETYLKQLEQAAQTDDDNLFAVSNLMKIYQDKNDEEQAKTYAGKVLQNPKHDDVMATRAKLILARYALKHGDENRAKELYAEVLPGLSGKDAAEALYYKAYFLSKEGQPDASNKVILKITKEYPEYKYWGAKALVLMARNLYAKKDVFNATYILENVVKRFPQFPGIVREANDLLKRIKNEQSAKNSDVPEK